MFLSSPSSNTVDLCGTWFWFHSRSPSAGKQRLCQWPWNALWKITAGMNPALFLIRVNATQNDKKEENWQTEELANWCGWNTTQIFGVNIWSSSFLPRLANLSSQTSRSVVTRAIQVFANQLVSSVKNISKQPPSALNPHCFSSKENKPDQVILTDGSGLEPFKPVFLSLLWLCGRWKMPSVACVWLPDCVD